MRFIDRNLLTPPKMLFGKEADKARSDMQFFIEQTLSSGASRRAPEPTWLDENPKFRRSIAQEFGHRCAYCESQALVGNSGNDGMIGRHRPATLAEDERGHTDLLAYVWLMYEWNNILWVCPNCARSKGNKFFIHGKRGEPFMSIEELRESEGDLLIDPCWVNPAEHLEFLASGPVIPRSPEGEATIDLLSLNGKRLEVSRRSAVLDFVLVLQTEEVISDGFNLYPKVGNEKLAHPGAVTSVIRQLAQMWGFAGAEVTDDLAGWLNSLEASERQNFCMDLLNEVGGQATVGSGPTSRKTASARASDTRIPNVRRLPHAQIPVTRVEIEHFKALRKIDFDLPERVEDDNLSPCMLLLGENATGKSSVLEAMALAIIGAEEAGALDRALRHEDLSPNDLIHRPDPYDWENTAPDMAIRLSFLDGDAPIELSADAGAALFDGIDHCSKVVLGYGPRRYFTSDRSRRLRAPAHRVRSLFDARDMIANPIHWLTQLERDEFYAAARALRVVLMLDDADDFERDDDPDTPGQIYIRQNGNRVALKDLSVGYKSVIAMVCDVIRELLYHYDNLEFAHAIVFVDEIETHLHPRWKMRIMSLLRQAFPKVQFIVTTHDPLCLRGMYDGEVFVLQRSAEDNVEQVVDLPSIRGMRSEQLLTSEFFGLGSTDPQTDARLARFNLLAARHENLSEDESDEMERLGAALDDEMVLGSTLGQQAYVEALKKRVTDRDVRPTQASSPDRGDLRETFSALFGDQTS